MIRAIFFLFFLFIISEKNHCQDKELFQSDMDFSFHLLKIKAYNEAIIYLNEIQVTYNKNTQRDSINYLLGKTYYLDKRLKPAINSFRLVGSQIKNLHQNAQFYMAFGYDYNKQYDLAIKVITDLKPKQDVYQQLKLTQLAGSYLLANNLKAFDTISQNFSQRHLPLQRTNTRLIKYAQEISEFKNKSAFVAGFLSAIIPGSGKIYAGKTGEGVSSFLQHLIFGLMLRESYLKHGTGSVQLGVFGAIFSTLYVSNIWSSTFSVKIYRNEYHDSLHESIMLDLHIPLRAILK